MTLNRKQIYVADEAVPEIGTDWTFKNAKVAENFDKHVRGQLPWYELMSGAVAHIARHYIPEEGTVLDLGCSTGNIERVLLDTLESRSVNFIGVDTSTEMISAYREANSYENTWLEQRDYADSDWEIPEYDVAILFLSLMFVTPSKRKDFIKRLLKSKRDGGCIIVVDKTEAQRGYIGTIMARLTLAGKVATGQDEVDIVAKELSLMGIQRPIKIEQFPNPVEIFRFGEFAGWIIE
jgi:tRNA (cmo5U34)-methyltransferase